MNILNFFSKKPRHIGFSHSLKCNLQCKQCKIWMFGSSDPLSLIQKKVIINKISIWNPGCTISLSGGEPFASKDTIPLIKYSIKNGLKVYLNTNGTLINDEICKKILKYKNKITISVSIDGPNSKMHDYLRNGKNIFARAINSIKILHKYGFKNVKILTVISSKNQNSLNKMCKLADELKVEKINFQPICLTGFGNKLTTHKEFKKNSLWPKDILAFKKNINILVNLKQTKYKKLINNSVKELQLYIDYFKNPFSSKYKCDFYKNGISIDYKGNLRVCYVVKNIIGNLLDDDINSLMLSNKRKILLKKMKNCSLPCKILSCHRKKDFKYYLNRVLPF